MKFLLLVIWYLFLEGLFWLKVCFEFFLRCIVGMLFVKWVS